VLYIIGLISSGIAFTILFLNEIGESKTYDWELVLFYVIFAISILIIAIPEGMPLSLTYSTFFAIRDLKHNNVFVKKFIGCETMGAVNFLLTDKTGTLTQNNMKFNKITIGNLNIDKSDVWSLNYTTKKLLGECIARNTNANIIVSDTNVRRVGN
jgi:P-type E1-E2 ATPase